MICIVLIHLKDRFQPMALAVRVDSADKLPSALAMCIVENKVDLSSVSKMEIYPP